MKNLIDRKQKFSLSLLAYICAVLILTVGVLAPVNTFYSAQAKAASLPAYRYTKTFDTSNGNAVGFDVTTDSLGNVYVAGDWSGTVAFDGTGGSDTQTTTNNSSFLTKYNANGTYAWTKTFDTTSGSSFSQTYTVATDKSGNVYFTGEWNGTVTFDGTGGSDTRTTANNDTFLTKYNANGSYGWTKTMDTDAVGASGISIGLTTDSLGNVYTTGDWSGTVTFDGTGGNDTQTSASSDTFLTKYNANGSYGWTKTMDSSVGNSEVTGVGLAFDGSGNLYMAGTWSGTVTFDGVGGNDTQTTANNDAFLTKYNANGSYAWTKTMDSSANGSFAEGFNVATDSSGNVYTIAQWNGTVTFDGTGGNDTQTTTAENIALTKYNADGSYAWTKTFDSSNGYAGGWEAPIDVAVDSLGDVYISGTWYGTVTFDGTGGSDTQTSNNPDDFLTKYNADGSYAWTKTADPSNSSGTTDIGISVATDAFGNLYITGAWTGTVTFDGTGGSDTRTTTGVNNDNTFLTSYQAFIPPTPPTSNISPGSSTLKAPDTGYEDPITKPWGTLAVDSLCAVTLFVLAGIYHRHTKSNYHRLR